MNRQCSYKGELGQFNHKIYFLSYAFICIFQHYLPEHSYISSTNGKKGWDYLFGFPMEDNQCSGNLLENSQFADARGAKTTHFTIKAQSRVRGNISVIFNKPNGKLLHDFHLCSADMTVLHTVYALKALKTVKYGHTESGGPNHSSQIHSFSFKVSPLAAPPTAFSYVTHSASSARLSSLADFSFPH